jgi:hypothetical protein
MHFTNTFERGTNCEKKVLTFNSLRADLRLGVLLATGCRSPIHGAACALPRDGTLDVRIDVQPGGTQ